MRSYWRRVNMLPRPSIFVIYMQRATVISAFTAALFRHRTVASAEAVWPLRPCKGLPNQYGKAFASFALYRYISFIMSALFAVFEQGRLSSAYMPLRFVDLEYTAHLMRKLCVHNGQPFHHVFMYAALAHAKSAPPLAVRLSPFPRCKYRWSGNAL